MSRRLLAVFFISAGTNHFAQPRLYRAIVPPSLQEHSSAVVALSGVAELLGGIGVLFAPTRRLAGSWLVAVLAAIFPANLYMAREPESFPRFPRWTLYARLPMQPLMMLWAWRATR